MTDGNEIDFKRINDKIRSAQPLEFQLIMLHEYDKLLSKKNKPLLPLNLFKPALQKSMKYWYVWQKHCLSLLSANKFFNLSPHTGANSKPATLSAGKKTGKRIKGLFFLEKDLNPGNSITANSI